MFIRDIMKARSQLAMQREAVRILTAIIDGLNVSPAPDGDKYQCSFSVDVEFLDRIGVWGAAEAELEDTDADTDGLDDMEADARSLQPLRELGASLAGIFPPLTEPPTPLPAPRLAAENEADEVPEEAIEVRKRAAK